MPLDILLIDDDEWSNMVHELVLSDISAINSYKIVSTGWEALMYLDNSHEKGEFPNLIIVDIIMPEMDGFSFVDHFEKQFFHLHPNTRILFVTNSIFEGDKIKAFSYKSTAQVIHKPLTEKKFKALLQSFDIEKLNKQN